MWSLHNAAVYTRPAVHSAHDICDISILQHNEADINSIGEGHQSDSQHVHGLFD